MAVIGYERQRLDAIAVWALKRSGQVEGAFDDAGFEVELENAVRMFDSEVNEVRLGFDNGDRLEISRDGPFDRRATVIVDHRNSTGVADDDPGES